VSRTLYDLFLRLWRLRPTAGRTKRDFLSLAELTGEEVDGLLNLAAEVKAYPSVFQQTLEGRAIALLFEKPSLRTRVTFEVGALQLGGHSIYLGPGDVGLGKRESAADVARNLARWVDAVVVRTFGHHTLEELAAAAHIPVVNALSDREHPCQAVADLLTVQEQKGRLRGLHLVFVGDGNNVAHSLAQGAAKTGMHFTLACPAGYGPDAAVWEAAVKAAAHSGAHLRVVHDAAEAVEGADAIYTDVWASMGQEAEAAERRRIFLPFQVNARLLARAKPDALFLHCLPAHRGEEVTDEVLDGRRSVVLEQAENRLHVAKAVLLALLWEVRQ
jgi:ornithine carbamoyltransferase